MSQRRYSNGGQHQYMSRRQNGQYYAPRIAANLATKHVNRVPSVNTVDLESPSRVDMMHIHCIILHLLAIQYVPVRLICAHKKLAWTHLQKLNPLRIRLIMPSLNIIKINRPDLCQYVIDKLRELYVKFDMPTPEQIYEANAFAMTSLSYLRQIMIYKSMEQLQLSHLSQMSQFIFANLHMLADVASQKS